ncbi:uncharacterized protein LOC119671948 isoform X1 [Teleopsis dalmanni]|uniref:uncharacterized protein LOC119671948 isoform X1 n=1 Tax=Teleopsis dalmanni TaxID=139649 RepID=UPI0018CEAEA2|nr:uncharacterized protein LOC119671948 isoform X1 [Teleopsis dalmanni]
MKHSSRSSRCCCLFCLCCFWLTMLIVVQASSAVHVPTEILTIALPINMCNHRRHPQPQSQPATKTEYFPSTKLDAEIPTTTHTPISLLTLTTTSITETTSPTSRTSLFPQIQTNSIGNDMLVTKTSTPELTVANNTTGVSIATNELTKQQQQIRYVETNIKISNSSKNVIRRQQKPQTNSLTTSTTTTTTTTTIKPRTQQRIAKTKNIITATKPRTNKAPTNVMTVAPRTYKTKHHSTITQQHQFTYNSFFHTLGTFNQVKRPLQTYGRYTRQAEGEPIDKCRLFVEGQAGKNELYSPDYPNHYPKNINCTRLITAPKGQIIRLDFRNSFHIEAKEECKFDFLEIRDGQYGFSNLIGKYCGTDFPDEITSKERYLWLHFHSDESIEYSGFTAVYEFIDRNREAPITDLNCTIDKDGYEGFINSTDVPTGIKETVTKNKIALDCIWRIQVQDKWKIQVKFLQFRLNKPNDCNVNFLDIFPEQTVMPLRVKNFCGSAGEGITSESNILNMRFYAEPQAITSEFSILYTAFRDRGNTCSSDEYDCEDATCISKELKCNGRDNCKFRWDEEGCDKNTAGQSEHVIIIIVVFGLILGGMVITFLVNCIRKIMRDQKIIREHIRQSKESKLDEMGRHSKARSRENISLVMSPSKKHSQTSLQILDDVTNGYYRELVPISVQTSKGDLKEKEHSILRHHHDMIVQTSLCGDDSSATTAEAPAIIEKSSNACDMGCQTRESLFAPSLERQKSISSSIGGSRGVATTTPRFSTFGYDMPPAPPPPAVTSNTIARRSIRVPHAKSEVDELRQHQHQLHQHHLHQHQQQAPTQPLHQTTIAVTTIGRPQENICHHHHQHQQHLQQQQQQQQPKLNTALPHTQQRAHQQQLVYTPKPQQHLSKAVITPTPVTALPPQTTITSSGKVTAATAPIVSGKNKQQQKSDESKGFIDIRNSAPDVIIMTSH